MRNSAVPVFLLLPVLLKTLDTWRFAAGVRIAMKFEHDVAVDDFYLKVKCTHFQKLNFGGIFEIHSNGLDSISLALFA